MNDNVFKWYDHLEIIEVMRLCRQVLEQEGIMQLEMMVEKLWEDRARLRICQRHDSSYGS
jgi:hypothetical protein